jgi:hypothetical protein
MYFEYRVGSHRRIFDPGSDPAGYRVLGIAHKTDRRGAYTLDPSDADAVSEATNGIDEVFITYLRNRISPVLIFHKD